MARETQVLMGMPITLEIVGESTSGLFVRVISFFASVDKRFSPFRADSEVSALNAGRLDIGDVSGDMRDVLRLAERTKLESGGYFDIRRPSGGIDPSGIVKGWAIRKAAELIQEVGFSNFYVDAGGDIQSRGVNVHGQPWRIGIRNPFNADEIVKTICPNGRGVATSGTSARGQHIYDPHRPAQAIADIVSLTVIGPDVLEADRFATAAFAMGEAGINFIERLEGFEGYQIGVDGRATWTSGFGEFVER